MVTIRDARIGPRVYVFKSRHQPAKGLGDLSLLRPRQSSEYICEIAPRLIKLRFTFNLVCLSHKPQIEVKNLIHSVFARVNGGIGPNIRALCTL